MTTDHPNYETVEVPPKKAPADLSYVERRAELLQHIRNAGHPAHINKSSLAEHYDVSRQTIYTDFDRLGEYLTEHVDASRAKAHTQVVFENAIRKLQEQGRPKEAARVAKWQWEFYVDVGIIDPDGDALHGDVEAENVAYYIDYEDDLDEEDVPRNADGSIDYGAMGFSSGPSTADVDTAAGEDQDTAPSTPPAESDAGTEADEQAAGDEQQAAEDGGDPAARSAMDAFESAAGDEQDAPEPEPARPEERDRDADPEPDPDADATDDSANDSTRGDRGRGERGRGHR